MADCWHPISNHDKQVLSTGAIGAVVIQEAGIVVLYRDQEDTSTGAEAHPVLFFARVLSIDDGYGHKTKPAQQKQSQTLFGHASGQSAESRWSKSRRERSLIWLVKSRTVKVITLLNEMIY